jgi:hypothetical protein
VWWATRFDVLVVAAGALVAWRMLSGRVDAVLLRRTLLILLFASFLTNRLRSYDPAVLAGVLIALGIAAVEVRGRVSVGRVSVGRVSAGWVSAGWAAIALGGAMAPVVLVAVAPLALVHAVRLRTIRPFLWLVAGGLLVAAEDWARRGGPFDTGYGGDRGQHTLLPYSGRPGFSYPFLLGVASILFSFGRGLVFFMPGLTLWLDRRYRDGRALLVPALLVVAGLVLVYAKWWAWYGGVTWGPRFFVFAALPASALVALRLARAGEAAAADLFALGVLALSSWVGYAGATSDYTQFGLCVRNGYALESMCWYEPSRSGLWWPVLHPPPFTWERAVLAAWCAATFAVLALPLLRGLAPRLRRLVALA